MTQPDSEPLFVAPDPAPAETMLPAPLTLGAAIVTRSLLGCTFAALDGVHQADVTGYFEDTVFPIYREITTLSPEEAERRIDILRGTIKANDQQAVRVAGGTKPESQAKSLRTQTLTALRRSHRYGQEHLRQALAEQVGRDIDWQKPDDTAANPVARTNPERSHQNVIDPRDTLHAAQQKSREDAELGDETAPSTDLVRVYLNQIGKIALLTAADEVELSQRIEAGLLATKLKAGELALSGSFARLAPTSRELGTLIRDGERAKDHLLLANLRLVVSLAKRYTGHGMPFLDLIQEGNLGLIRAVEKFDYTKGFKFSTYATWWIRQNISRAMADQGRTIRLPVHLTEEVNKMERIRREMGAAGRDITDAEIAEEMDIDEDRVKQLVDWSRDLISLDQEVGPHEDASLGDFVADERGAIADQSSVEDSFMRDQLHTVLVTLDEREAAVVKMRYGLDDGQPRTLDDIGRAFKLSRERIRQIERETMAKLRHPSRAQALRDFLDD